MPLISTQEVKEFLRVKAESHDSMVESLLAGATSWVETYCNISLCTKVITINSSGGTPRIKSPTRPLRGVESVYDNISGSYVDSDDYRMDSAAIYHKSGLWEEGPGRWTVVATVGYTSNDAEPDTPSEDPVIEVPAPDGIKIPILILVRSAYQARGDNSLNLAGASVAWQELASNRNIERLLYPFRAL